MKSSRGMVAVLLSALCVCGCGEEEKQQEQDQEEERPEEPPDFRSNVTGRYGVTGTWHTALHGQPATTPMQDILVIEPEAADAGTVDVALLRVTLEEIGRQGCTFRARMDGEKAFIPEVSDCALDYVAHCWQSATFRTGRGEKLPSGTLHLSLQGTYSVTCAVGEPASSELVVELTSQ